jgi:hypothetical protein
MRLRVRSARIERLEIGEPHVRRLVVDETVNPPGG